MGTARRTVLTLALAGAVAGVVPAFADAAVTGSPGCTFPKSWETAPADLQYEADLFSGQTLFDLSRVTTANAATYALFTVKRAQRMANADAATLTVVAKDGVANPPRCGA